MCPGARCESMRNVLRLKKCKWCRQRAYVGNGYCLVCSARGGFKTSGPPWSKKEKKRREWWRKRCNEWASWKAAQDAGKKRRRDDEPDEPSWGENPWWQDMYDEAEAEGQTPDDDDQPPEIVETPGRFRRQNTVQAKPLHQPRQGLWPILRKATEAPAQTWAQPKHWVSPSRAQSKHQPRLGLNPSIGSARAGLNANAIRINLSSARKATEASAQSWAQPKHWVSPGRAQSKHH